MDAITFPREWPAGIRIATMVFRLNDGNVWVPHRGGDKTGVNIADPLFSAEITTKGLKASEYGELRAFLATVQRGGTFLLHDIRRPYPINHPGGWPGFDGNCTLIAVEDDMVRITLDGLPQNFIMAAGDYLGFVNSAGIRCLHFVSQGGTADGAGEIDLQVEPPILDGWEGSPAPVVTLYRASAEFVVRNGSYSESHAGRFTTISFTGDQVLAPAGV